MVGDFLIVFTADDQASGLKQFEHILGGERPHQNAP